MKKTNSNHKTSKKVPVSFGANETEMRIKGNELMDKGPHPLSIFCKLPLDGVDKYFVEDEEKQAEIEWEIYDKVSDQAMKFILDLGEYLDTCKLKAKHDLLTPDKINYSIVVQIEGIDNSQFYPLFHETIDFWRDAVGLGHDHLLTFRFGSQADQHQCRYATTRTQ